MSESQRHDGTIRYLRARWPEKRNLNVDGTRIP